MGFLTSLKFDRCRGAVLVNEETYSVRHRRKLFLDGIQSLVTPEMADAWGIEAVYTGVGSPWVHQEIIDLTRKELAERFEKEGRGKKKGHATLSTKDVGIMAAKHLQKIIRRDMNLKLNLFYGFHADDLTRGSYTSDGKSWEIKQDKVKTKALDIINGVYSDRNTGIYKETRGHIFAWDQHHGIVAWHLDIRSGNVAYNMEAYEMLGIGKHALETSLCKLLNNVSYPQRQKGIPPSLGMYELIAAALAAREAYHATQGNVQIAYLDCSAEGHAQRYHEYVDEQSRCAVHVVQASEAGWLDKAAARELLEKVLFKNKDRKDVERELFARCTNPTALDFVLRGYKVHEIAELAQGWKPTGGSKRRGA